MSRGSGGDECVVRRRCVCGWASYVTPYRGPGNTQDVCFDVALRDNPASLLSHVQQHHVANLPALRVWPEPGSMPPQEGDRATLQDAWAFAVSNLCTTVSMTVNNWEVQHQPPFLAVVPAVVVPFGVLELWYRRRDSGMAFVGVKLKAACRADDFDNVFLSLRITIPSRHQDCSTSILAASLQEGHDHCRLAERWWPLQPFTGTVLITAAATHGLPSSSETWPEEHDDLLSV